jgi:beta-lactamase class A
VRLRDPEALTNSTGKGYRRRTAERKRLSFILSGLSLLLAFAGAGTVLFFGGGVAMEQGVIKTDEERSSAIERSPLAGPAFTGPSSVGEALDFDVEALRGRIEEITEGRLGTYGVAVLEPVSGTRVSLRGDDEFVVASIGKLPAFATLYRAAALGELDLNEEISLRSSDIQGYGSGSLETFPVGHSLSLGEIAYRLVNHSDNTAWAMLDRHLGADKIKAELENMGLESSRYYDYRSGYYTTPNDVLLLLRKISDPEFTSEELSEEMLDAMTETSLEDRIPEKLPLDVRVAHKTGSYGYNFSDAGVVFYKDGWGVERRYYLVVLARGAGEPEAREVIQSISLAVYEALTGVTVDPEWSRGKSASLESAAEEPLAVPTQSWPAENTVKNQESTGRYDKSAEPATPLPDERSSSEGQRTTTPYPPSASSSADTTVKKPANSSKASSMPASSKDYGDWYSKRYEDWE